MAASGAEWRNVGLHSVSLLVVGHTKALAATKMLLLRGSSSFAGGCLGPGSHHQHGWCIGAIAACLLMQGFWVVRGPEWYIKRYRSPGSFPGCYLLLLFFFLFFSCFSTFLLFPMGTRCQWQPALQLGSTLRLQLGVRYAAGRGGFRGDVSVHRPLSYSGDWRDKCQSKRWYRKKWRLWNTAKNKDPIFAGE